VAYNRLPRRKIAAYFADELLAGHDVTRQLAAYLVETKRVREARLIVRDIEAALADRGVLLADVVSSRDLAADTKDAITSFLKKATGAHDVKLRTSVNANLLGGVLIETPSERLDASLRHRLNQLRATKI